MYVKPPIEWLAVMWNAQGKVFRMFGLDVEKKQWAMLAVNLSDYKLTGGEGEIELPDSKELYESIIRGDSEFMRNYIDFILMANDDENTVRFAQVVLNIVDTIQGE